mmetsp:Transcript_134390/g.374567  ORF Transcript_134390/g.374567 Transcript_134390/m.374567 type:complete len:249 (+) Transcript_134390:281-1027(+)
MGPFNAPTVFKNKSCWELQIRSRVARPCALSALLAVHSGRLGLGLLLAHFATRSAKVRSLETLLPNVDPRHAAGTASCALGPRSTRHAPRQARHLLDDHSCVHSPGRPTKLQATAEKLLDADGAGVVEVHEAEKALCLGFVDIHVLEKVHHLRGVDLGLELLPRQRAFDPTVYSLEDLVHAVDQVIVLVSFGMPQHRLDEQACDNIHDCKDGECHVQEEHSHRDVEILLGQRLQKLIPVYATCDGLEQ